MSYGNKKGHLPMKMSPCAGEGNRKYVTPIFGEKSNRSNIKHIILLIINNLAIHLSLYINVNQ